MSKKRISTKKAATTGFAENKEHKRLHLPTVSICTVTYNRARFLTLLKDVITKQTYPHDLLEWIVVDDSDIDQPAYTPDRESTVRTLYKKLDRRLSIGAKRNLSHTFCKGEIIVYMDDDDYYPATRVEHAVDRLIKSKLLMAGCTEFPVYFVHDKEVWVTGPFHERHATAGTFAFKRSLLGSTGFDETVERAEEKSFLKDYTIPMVQLDPAHTIVCIAHEGNTFDKRNLRMGGLNPNFRRQAPEDARVVIDRLGFMAKAYEEAGRIAKRSQMPVLQPLLLTSYDLDRQAESGYSRLSIILVQHEKNPEVDEAFWALLPVVINDEWTEMFVIEDKASRISEFILRLGHSSIHSVRCSESSGWAERVSLGIKQKSASRVFLIDEKGLFNIGFAGWWYRMRREKILDSVDALIPSFSLIGAANHVDDCKHLRDGLRKLGEGDGSVRSMIVSQFPNMLSISSCIFRPDAVGFDILLAFTRVFGEHLSLLKRCHRFAYAAIRPFNVSSYNYFIYSAEKKDVVTTLGDHTIDFVLAFRNTLSQDTQTSLTLDQLAGLLRIKEAAISCAFFEAYYLRFSNRSDWDKGGYLESVTWILKEKMLIEIKHNRLDLMRTLQPDLASVSYVRSVLVEGLRPFIGSAFSRDIEKLACAKSSQEA